MPDLFIDAALPLPALLLLAVIAYVVAFWYYRRAGTRGRSLLAFLRGSALVLVVLVLARLEVRISRSSTELPRLAILLDNSASLRTTEPGGPRYGPLNAFLRSTTPASLARRAEIRYFTFGLSLRHLDALPADSLEYSEEATDIAAALRSLEQGAPPEHPDGAMVISDGTFTRGHNPVHGAERSPYPLFTVLVGDSLEQPDLVLTRIASNSTVFSGLATPVQVRLRSSGFGEGTATVRLLRGTEELNRKDVTLEAGSREYTLALSYTPSGEGSQRITALIEPVRGEITAANNRGAFTAEVLRSRLRILLLAGVPSPDVAAMRQMLVEERDFDVRSYTLKRGGSFYEGVLSRAVLDSADCLILVGFPSAAASDVLLSWVSGRLSRGIPLFFLDGKGIDHGRLSALGPWLPFTAELPSSVEITAAPRPAPGAQSHPLLAGEDPSRTRSWGRLPPLFRTLTAYRTKAEAAVLLLASIDGVPSSDPLLLARSAGGERSVALLGYGVYRWKLMTAGDPESATLFGDFLTGAVRWLTAPPDIRQLRVRPAREGFVQGEPVEFQAEAYTAAGTPLERARITVAVPLAGRTLEAELVPAGGGRYEGTIEGLPPGEYSYVAAGETASGPVGRDLGRFTVGEPALEFLDTRSSPALLRELASRSGGCYLGSLTAADFDTALFSHPAMQLRRVEQSSLFQIWTPGWILASVIALLASEWLLRRRSGLL
jgi:hypothetical protein